MRRLRTHTPRPDRDGPAERAPEPFEPRDLVGLFATPPWLRDLGQSAWLAVGVTVFIVAVVWVLTLTQTIVMPVIAASVIAAVASPLVRWISSKGPTRGIAAALVFIGFILVGIGVVVLVVGGIDSQASALSGHLTSAKDTIGNWLSDLGVDKGSVDTAKKDASDALSSIVPSLLDGLGTGIKKLSSLVFFLALTILSLFFLLKDGPIIRAWAESHMRVPPRAAHQMTGRVLSSLRGYFLGVTIVAAFNAVVVGIGALILGVPLAGTIALITFLGAYVPYLGAWGAGAFAVLIALGGAGTDAAIGMAIVQLLANGILQQMIQPIAYGAALGIHPLAVLVVTIGGGALFGAVGLILAAPLTAAATRIAADLAATPPEGEPPGVGAREAPPPAPEPETAPVA